jgi:hypothetical protein
MVLLILTRLRISLIPSGLLAFHASDELQYDFSNDHISFKISIQLAVKITHRILNNITIKNTKDVLDMRIICIAFRCP